jgi:hypothetical protein
LGAILYGRLLYIHQPQVGFVEQRRALQGMAGTFAAHIGLGQAMRFLVNERSQFFQRGLISGAPGKEQLSDFRPRGLGHRTSLSVLYGLGERRRGGALLSYFSSCAPLNIGTAPGSVAICSPHAAFDVRVGETDGHLKINATKQGCVNFSKTIRPLSYMSVKCRSISATRQRIFFTGEVLR